MNITSVYHHAYKYLDTNKVANILAVYQFSILNLTYIVEIRAVCADLHLSFNNNKALI